MLPRLPSRIWGKIPQDREEIQKEEKETGKGRKEMRGGNKTSFHIGRSFLPTTSSPVYCADSWAESARAIDTCLLKGVITPY